VDARAWLWPGVRLLGRRSAEGGRRRAGWRLVGKQVSRQRVAGAGELAAAGRGSQARMDSQVRAARGGEGWRGVARAARGGEGGGTWRGVARAAGPGEESRGVARGKPEEPGMEIL